MTIGLTTRENRDIWPADRDALLMDAIADGMSFTEAGRAIGSTKNQAVGRFKRLAHRMGWQAA